MTTSFKEQLRDRIYAYLIAAGVKLECDHEQNQPYIDNWEIAGGRNAGVMVNFSDKGDEIVFGMVSCTDELNPAVVLCMSIGLEDERASLNCSSDTFSDLNFSGVLLERASRKDLLSSVCRRISQVMGQG